MKDINKLLAKQAKELTWAQKENELEAMLPQDLPGELKQIYFQRPNNENQPEDGFPWVTYDARTLEGAFEIIEAFGELRPVEARKDSCISIEPPEYQYASYKDAELKFRLEEGILVRATGMRDQQTMELTCWPKMTHMRLNVRLGGHTVFTPCIRFHFNRFGECTSGEVLHEPLFKLAPYRIRYGGVLSSIHISYGFDSLEQLRQAHEKRKQ